MAEIIGTPGDSAQEESYRILRHRVWTAYFAVLLTGILLGWILVGGRSATKGNVFLFLLAAAVISVYRVYRAMDRHARAERNWRSGAEGEVFISRLLSSLPDEFVVINDIPKRFGNIDHVVIGRTGVYLLNTKNWRGTVSADATGEILLNGRKTDKPEVRNLERAAMDLHKKLQGLCETDYFVRGVMVFVHSKVNADFTTTKHVHCLAEDHLLDYLENKRFAGRLTAHDVHRIKDAVLKIAKSNGGVKEHPQA